MEEEVLSQVMARWNGMTSWIVPPELPVLLTRVKRGLVMKQVTICRRQSRREVADIERSDLCYESLPPMSGPDSVNMSDACSCRTYGAAC